jgi:hypothetical protein
MMQLCYSFYTICSKNSFLSSTTSDVIPLGVQSQQSSNLNINSTQITIERTLHIQNKQDLKQSKETSVHVERESSGKNMEAKFLNDSLSL